MKNYISRVNHLLILFEEYDDNSQEKFYEGKETIYQAVGEVKQILFSEGAYYCMTKIRYLREEREYRHFLRGLGPPNFI